MNIEDRVLEAVREASVSVACLMDDMDNITHEDLVHIQNQITFVESCIEPFKKGESNE
tara:strand:- start:302 stop:475 length:174 start_codon:yes stop_codon:yes gene_type:complete